MPWEGTGDNSQLLQGQHPEAGRGQEAESSSGGPGSGQCLSKRESTGASGRDEARQGTAVAGRWPQPSGLRGVRGGGSGQAKACTPPFSPRVYGMPKSQMEGCDSADFMENTPEAAP